MSLAGETNTVTEHLYKVLVIGDFGVGKTSIIRRFTEGTFSSNYKLTIGVDFSLKAIDWNEKTRVNLQLWDIAGHERFGHMTRVYYKYAIAAVVVYDLSRPATFDSILKWSEDVHQKVMLANEQPIPLLLLANKCDINDAAADDRALNKFCTENKFIGWFATSAKENTNISEAMEFLIRNILELTTNEVQPQDHISLHQDTDYFETMEQEKEETGPQCCR